MPGQLWATRQRRLYFDMSVEQSFAADHLTASRDRRGTVIMAIFFIQALAGGSLTTRIADFQTNLGLSESVLGLALLGAAVSGFLCYLVAGRLVEVFGTRIIFLTCLPAIAALAWAHAVAWNATSLFVVGLFFGIPWSVVNVAMNVEADRLEAETGARIMSRCHGWWSAGMLLTALIAVFARGWQVSPALHFVWFVPMSVAASWFLVRPMQAAELRRVSIGAKKRVVAWPTFSVAILVAFGLAGGFAQVTVQNWSVIYMRDSFAVPDGVDTLSLSLFLLSLTLGRLLADGWNSRYGTSRVVMTLAAVALIGVFVVVFAPNAVLALVGFGMIGLGVCSLYPAMTTAAALIGDRAASDNVAAINLLTGLAMLIVPPLIGFVADGFGIRAAFALMLPVLLVTIVLTPRVTGRS